FCSEQCAAWTWSRVTVGRSSWSSFPKQVRWGPSRLPSVSGSGWNSTTSRRPEQLRYGSPFRSASRASPRRTWTVPKTCSRRQTQRCIAQRTAAATRSARRGSSAPRELVGVLVIPAKAGIHLLPISFALSSHSETDDMYSRFRGNDESRSPVRADYEKSTRRQTLLSSNPLQLHQHAVILHHVDSVARDLFRRLVVANAELEPDGFRVLRDYVVDMLWNVLRAPKDVDDVDVAGNIDERAVHRLAEHFLDIGIVNRDRNDFVARALSVFGNVIRRLLRVGLDPEHRDAPGSLQEVADLLRSREKMVL